MPTLTTKKKTPGALKRARLVTAADVLETCGAAARLALQGENYSREDREDTATRLVLLVLERAKLDAETGACGDVFPARLIGFDFLVKRAANERSAIDARRARIELESTGNDGLAGESTTGKLAVHGAATADTPDPLNDGTPSGARRQALRMLADAGLWEGSRPWTLTPNAPRGEYAQGALWSRVTGAPWSAPMAAPRASAPRGPLWTLAYTAARAADGIDAEELAAELDLTRTAHRAQCSRAARELAKSGHDIRAWLTALNTDGADWTAPDKVAKERERTRPDVPADVISRTAPKRASARGSDWSRPRKVPRQPDGRKTVGGPDTPVDPLSANRRARLDKATRMRRARADAQTPDARKLARLASGLPAEVR